MKRLNFDGPINNLSLGNVSINFLRQLREKNIDLSIFPVHDKADFTAFDKLTDEFKKWCESIGVIDLPDKFK